MLVDPLSDKPVVVTGSANFSDASRGTNDENMRVPGLQGAQLSLQRWNKAGVCLDCGDVSHEPRDEEQARRSEEQAAERMRQVIALSHSWYFV